MSLRRSRIQARPNLASRSQVVQTIKKPDTQDTTTEKQVASTVGGSTGSGLRHTSDKSTNSRALQVRIDGSNDSVLSSEVQNEEIVVDTAVPAVAKSSSGILRRVKPKPNLTVSSRVKRSTIVIVEPPTVASDSAASTPSTPIKSPHNSQPITDICAENIPIESPSDVELEVAVETVINEVGQELSCSEVIETTPIRPTSPVKESTKKKNPRPKPTITAPRDQPADRFTMKMADLLFWNPIANPMSRKDASNLVPKPKKPLELDAAPATAYEDSAEDSSLMVPQVKLAPDGSVIVNEESLVVETIEPAIKESQLGETIVEDENSNINYFSFGKNRARPKSWSAKETEKFYWALNRLGTDFSMIAKIFPNRDRGEIKLKFKKEERTNRQAIAQALDGDYKSLEMAAFDEPYVPPPPKPAKPRKDTTGYIRKPKNYYDDQETLTSQNNVVADPSIEAFLETFTAETSNALLPDRNDLEDGFNNADNYEDTHKTIAKPDVVTETDIEELKVMSSMMRPTRYGRTPKRALDSTDTLIRDLTVNYNTQEDAGTSADMGSKKPRHFMNSDEVTIIENQNLEEDSNMVQTSMTNDFTVMNDASSHRAESSWHVYNSGMSDVSSLSADASRQVYNTQMNDVTTHSVDTGWNEVSPHYTSDSATTVIVSDRTDAYSSESRDNFVDILPASDTTLPASSGKALNIQQLKSAVASPGNQLILVKQAAKDGSGKCLVHVYVVSKPPQGQSDVEGSQNLGGLYSNLKLPLPRLSDTVNYTNTNTQSVRRPRTQTINPSSQLAGFSQFSPGQQIGAVEKRTHTSNNVQNFVNIAPSLTNRTPNLLNIASNNSNNFDRENL